MRRSAFTLIELLITLSILAIVGAAVIPNYHTYKIRSDLSLAVEQTEQMLKRAQLLSQSGKHASQWGFRAESGTLFRGTDFASRDTTYDEVASVPESVTVSGLLEVTYSQVYGMPSAAGDIIFTALNGEQIVLTIRADSVLRAPNPPSSASSMSSSSKKKQGDDDSDDDEDDDEGDDDSDDDD